MLISFHEEHFITNEANEEKIKLLNVNKKNEKICCSTIFSRNNNG
jgi:hypothetical protein